MSYLREIRYEIVLEDSFWVFRNSLPLSDKVIIYLFQINIRPVFSKQLPVFAVHFRKLFLIVQETLILFPGYGRNLSPLINRKIYVYQSGQNDHT